MTDAAEIFEGFLTADGKIRRHRLQDRYPGFQIGRGSYGDLAVVGWDDRSRFSVGAFCSFAAGVKILLGGEHRTDWVTTYPFNAFWRAAADVEGHPRSKGDVVIGNDVWVGTEALILSGVTIGDGAVVGARSVVTEDVPPYAIHAGHPARLVRMRFGHELVADLLALRWWDWPDERIERLLPLMLDGDVGKFLDAAEKERKA